MSNINEILNDLLSSFSSVRTAGTKVISRLISVVYMPHIKVILYCNLRLLSDNLGYNHHKVKVSSLGPSMSTAAWPVATPMVRQTNMVGQKHLPRPLLISRGRAGPYGRKTVLLC